MVALLNNNKNDVADDDDSEDNTGAFVGRIHSASVRVEP
jgi:hypothetical protein